MASHNFIGRFEHSCGRVRAIYKTRAGGTGTTGWYASEREAAETIPLSHSVDSKNHFVRLGSE